LGAREDAYVGSYLSVRERVLQVEVVFVEKVLTGVVSAVVTIVVLGSKLTH
jgi:hypothetical protein